MFRLLKTPVDLFSKILQVNLIGSFVVAREAARHMAKRGRGSIVNIASVSGMIGNSGRVAYGASKAGVLQATRVMAIEWAPLGLRVNAIAPGPVETPLVAQDAHHNLADGVGRACAHASLCQTRRTCRNRNVPAGRYSFRLYDRSNTGR